MRSGSNDATFVDRVSSPLLGLLLSSAPFEKGGSAARQRVAGDLLLILAQRLPGIPLAWAAMKQETPMCTLKGEWNVDEKMDGHRQEQPLDSGCRLKQGVLGTTLWSRETEMTRWIACVLALLLAFPVLAGGPKAVRKQVESSMVLTGTIDVGADGGVEGYKIDDVEKIPEGVSGLVAKFVPQWKFEPVLVAGKPAKARAKMSMRIVAKELDDDSFAVGIHGANFGQDGPGESVESRKMTPPRYPVEAARNGASGTVYLVLQIDRDGNVRDAVAEQINLTFIASEPAMARWRDVFARSALRAAEKWTFNPPVKGESVDDKYWLVRVPVDYFWGDKKPPGYGHWKAYVPGPRQVAPWGDPDTATTATPDALPPGGVFQLGQGLRLLTPLDQG